MGGMTETYAAFLRAVNVGGRGKLPMKQLAPMFEACGCSGVRTFIQSGNVVFRASPKVVKSLVRQLGDSIESNFAFRPAILLRSLLEMEAVFERNPFPGHEEESFVFFLESEPSPAAMASIDPQRSPDDRFVLVGKQLYVHYAGRSSDSKLTGAYLESKLKVGATARNWRTVRSVLELMRLA